MLVNNATHVLTSADDHLSLIRNVKRPVTVSENKSRLEMGQELV